MLTERFGVTDSTIHRFEASKAGMQTGTIDRHQMALEAEGVTFINADASGGPNVRLKALYPV